MPGDRRSSEAPPGAVKEHQAMSRVQLQRFHDTLLAMARAAERVEAYGGRKVSRTHSSMCEHRDKA